MLHLHISGIVNNKVRYTTVENVAITEEQMSTITPLAQTDVMQTFLFGINDSFIKDIDEELPRQIQSGINSIDDTFFAENKKQKVQQELSMHIPLERSNQSALAVRLSVPNGET